MGRWRDSVAHRLAEKCVCPMCHGALTVSSEGMSCCGCGASFPLIDGIPNFLVKGPLLERVRELSRQYDLASGRYRDSARSCGYCGERAHCHGLEVLRRWIHCGEVEGKCILDVGCGVGLMTRELALRNEVWGVDISLGLLKIARLHGIEVVMCSGDSLPFPANSFDLVLCVGVLPYFEDPEGIVKELCRVARTKGLVIVTSTADSLLVRSVRWLKRLIGVRTDLARLYSCCELEGYLAMAGAQVLASCTAYNRQVFSTREGRVPWHLKILGRVNAVMATVPTQRAGPETPEG
ncbi:MAG: methyltransferase domain-containing protein [Thermodesulfobacteriota bacterium]